MKGRDKLFFNLLSFLLVVVIVIVGVKTRETDKQIKKWQSEIKRRAERGVQDPQLRETVDKLEEDLRVRLAETFDMDSDPLDLTRVIKTKKFLKKLGMSESAESDYRMRLSATVTSSDKGASAIIKYLGRSNMLSVGESIGGYRVAEIGRDRVILVRAGERLVLKTEKAPDSIAEEQLRYGPNGENLPKIGVKKVAPQS